LSKNRTATKYRRWRKKVIKRDEYICVKCRNELDLEYLTAHHIASIDNNPELELDIDNGICICLNCHEEFHDVFGYGNNNKKQFEEFIN
jgi:5-methylcytosine-specific restriction endonuclease McrA